MGGVIMIRFPRRSTLLYSATTVLVVATAISCGKKDKKSGGSIGAPQAYPPTKTVTPTQLVNSSGTSSLVEQAYKSTLSDDISSLQVTQHDALSGTPVEPSTDAEKNTAMADLKSRLFSEGPTNLLKLIKNVDARMAEYDQRVSGSESAPSCLSSTPVDLSSVFSVPAASGTTTLPIYGQCRDSINGLTLIFGKKDTDWYLVDGATKDTDGSASCVASMVKISGTTDATRVVDGHMVVTYKAMTNNFTGSTTLMHFKSDVAAGTLEFTAGGVNIGYNQVHAKSDANYLYLLYQNSASSSAGTLYHACFKASDLTLASSINDCTSLKNSLSLVSLGTKAIGSSGGQTIPPTDANNVDLTQLVTNYCDKLGTAFSEVPAFGLK